MATKELQKEEKKGLKKVDFTRLQLKTLKVVKIQLISPNNLEMLSTIRAKNSEK